MTDVVIERLRITCRSTSADHAEALEMRRRLESIARVHLPVALERTVPWVDARALGSFRIVLDFDPARYDDVTVALLWADRIRQRVLVGRASRGRRMAAELPTVAGAASDDLRALVSILHGRDVETVALRALARDGVALDELVAVAAEPAVLDVFFAALPETLRPVVRALIERLEAEPAARRRTMSVSDGHATRPAHGAAPEREGGADLTLASAEGSRPRGEREDVSAGRELGASRAPASQSPGARLSHGTAIGGIALLWPWLPGFLGQAGALHPELNAVAARRLALARLVPDRERADSDLLVRFFAGDDLEGSATALLPLRRQDEVDEAADSVLRAFASVLPGFERSTFDYLRRELLVRPGAFDLDAEPVRLTLGSMPLDPVLAFLPYPIETVRLPWTPPLAIDLEMRA